MGFKDGTRNIAGTETDRAEEARVGRASKDGPAWMTGGSYLVARRIRMHIETWDRTPLQEQEDIFGRDKGEGAPVGKAKERDEPFLKAMLPDAHVRLAHPDSNDGATILRRGYSFTDGTDGLGRLDAGLFFLAYQRDVRKGFVPVQRSLARRRAQRVHPARGFSGLRGPARRPRQGRLVGPGTVLEDPTPMDSTHERSRPCSATI